MALESLSTSRKTKPRRVAGALEVIKIAILFY